MISIHALLAESDYHTYTYLSILYLISIHALLAESDFTFLRPLVLILQFLSTLSLRRATMIHPLLCNVKPNFYPRSPCGERQARRASRQQPAGISIHALLAESDRRGASESIGTLHFYPRSPCGERPRKSQSS